jgi:FAD/FMN-containing dehydrogenase
LEGEEIMTGRQLVDLQGNAVHATHIEGFVAGLRGEAIQPADAGYDEARRIWNASIERHPGLIVRCVGVADVIDAVRFARSHGLEVAIRGGGHNVGGRAVCDGGLVIDLCRMKGVRVDAKARTVWAQAGCTLGDLDRETHLKGLAVPVGVVSKTGIAGLTLGGGVGWLVRKYGLTCDNVLAYELVGAEGQLLTASAEENADLYWALRGGGGNFGVVTSFLYRAHPVSRVLGGMVVWPRDKARDVLRFYRDFIAAAPDELTAYSALLYTPDGMPAVGVIACWCGEPAAGEAALKPLRSFGAPLLDAIQPIPMPQMQSMLDGAFPPGNQNYWKSSFVRALDDDLIDAILAHAAKAPSPLTALVIENYGGAAARVAPDATAFAHRAAAFDIGTLAQWSDPAQSEANIAWARAFADALKPHSSGGYFLNFLDQEGDDTIRAAFGPNYARLAKIKAKYDPTNFFRLNQNIKPAA